MLVALLAGLGVALAKVGAAVVTSSPAMAAEASHSLADTANDLFFVIAQTPQCPTTRRTPSLRIRQRSLLLGAHCGPWDVIAGAAVSLRAGVNERIHPSTTSSFIVAYVGGCFRDLRPRIVSSVRHEMIVEARVANQSILDQAATTSDPSLRGVFNEDAVSVAGDVSL